jgi:hypothetical protein
MALKSQNQSDLVVVGNGETLYHLRTYDIWMKVRSNLIDCDMVRSNLIDSEIFLSNLIDSDTFRPNLTDIDYHELLHRH